MGASGTKEHMSDAELEQRSNASRSHGVYSYRDSGDLPARLGENFDRELAKELLEHAGGDPAFQLLAQSAARRATMIELAYSWLGAEDVKVMWAENEDGHKIVKMQPILKALGSWHEGLRRDLAELGLTPQSRSKLGLPEAGTVDYEKIIEARRKKERENGGDDES
jgi:hypothetical protein